MEELIMEYNKPAKEETKKNNTGTKITPGCFDDVEGVKIDITKAKKKTRKQIRK